jgi:excisionase family DNA binding protein
MVKITKPEEGRMIYTAGEACHVLGLSWNTVRKLVRGGEIRVKRVGRRYLFPKEAIEMFLNRESYEAKVFLKGLK